MKDSRKHNSIIHGILETMTAKQRGKVAMLAILGVFRSLAETVSTGAVLPYMVVLLDTKKAKGLPVLREIYVLTGSNEMKFILLSTALFFVLYAFRCAYLVFYDYVDGRIIRKISSDYSVKLFRYYITRPYEFFFDRNTSILQRNVTTVISGLLQGVISNSLYLFTYGLTFIMLLALMLFSGVAGLLTAAILLMALYLVLSRYVKRKAKEIAEQTNRHSKTLHKTVLESFRGIKDVMLNADEQNLSSFVSREYDAGNALKARRNLLNSIPNQILELGTVAILTIILISGYRTAGMEESLATLSLCGASAIRIRSALSGILSKMTAIKDNSAYYEEVIGDIRASLRCDFLFHEKEEISFERQIEIRNLTYRYPNSEKDIFHAFHLTINKGEAVGIAGPSGRGKSTLADLLAGLISPEEGEILIDGLPLKGRETVWRDLVGYVPQEIFLLDGTVLENIALFEPASDIDRDRARKALQTAQILDFINTLPQREDSRIGDNGILLSGGQRQRIGIARALYRSPEILIFDEATNSLDTATEKAFLETVNSLRNDYTMIMISHRKETLSRCDRVVELEDTEI